MIPTNFLKDDRVCYTRKHLFTDKYDHLVGTLVADVSGDLCTVLIAPHPPKFQHRRLVTVPVTFIKTMETIDEAGNRLPYF